MRTIAGHEVYGDGRRAVVSGAGCWVCRAGGNFRKCLRDHWGTGAVLSSARGESAGGAEPEFAGSAGWQTGREHRLSGGEFGNRRGGAVAGEVSAGCAGS